MKKAIVFLADGTEECEALLVVDILRRAKIEVTTVSVSDSQNITSSHNISICTDKTIKDTDFDDSDIIILPGGIPGTYNLQENSLVCEKCIEFSKNKTVAAVCAAPSILASIGILNGKSATCAPAFEDKMAGATLTHESVTVDGNIITGQGLGVSIPFALKIVEMLDSRNTAEEVAAKICYRGNF